MKKYLRLPSFGRFCLYPALALSFAFLAMTAYADDDRKYIPVSDYNRLLIQDRMILAATVGFLCLLLGGIIVMIRIGQGYDVHQLVEGRKLILCGVPIAHPTGLLEIGRAVQQEWRFNKFFTAD